MHQDWRALFVNTMQTLMITKSGQHRRLQKLRNKLQILKEEIPMPSRGSISWELRAFLGLCLCKDPFQRAHAEELLRHPFITKVYT